MNESTLKALGVTQEAIDALNVVLNSAIPGVSVAAAHLKAALAALESADAAEQKKEPARQHKPSGLDSLGSGNIL
ncbi:hypothetical protein [Pseudomonas fluorescens]|uniref:hypothetical protein n=1 Tax=Pseudomonas fluorescens TaxID=294 RepID=UPI002B1D9612|nr:hypothetical protein [Pseudomonas fluorescens]